MQYKAVSLISGGLDSMLATKAMLEQGIHVEGINFFTGFCVEGHTHAIRKTKQDKPKRNNALWVAEQLGIKMHIIDIVEPYKDVVLNPKHGYGANLNPCLDCKIFMVEQAKKWIEENDFDFIITGEVKGQRPMSQRAKTMPIIADESGAEDLLLRPLCAKGLPPTKPEREGWVDREQLFDFSGRSRKPQIELAEKWGLNDFAQPAGGCCFLTDANYSQKLQDLWQHRDDRQYELDDIIMLKLGRHIRPNSNFKVIVAREEGEVEFMKGYGYLYPTLKTDIPGPSALIDGRQMSDEDFKLAAQIVAAYSKAEAGVPTLVHITEPSKADRSIEVVPLDREQINKAWLL